MNFFLKNEFFLKNKIFLKNDFIFILSNFFEFFIYYFIHFQGPSEDTIRSVVGKEYVCFYQKWPHTTQVPFNGTFLRFYDHDNYIKLFKMEQKADKLEYTPIKFSPPDSFHPRHDAVFLAGSTLLYKISPHKYFFPMTNFI